MNKETLFRQIIDNYATISDNQYSRHENDIVFISNTEKEDELMHQLWLQIIDHIYVADRMSFAYALIRNDKLYLIFTGIDNNKLKVVHVDETMTPEDLTDIRLELLKYLEG